MDWFRAYSPGILRGSLSNADDNTQIVWIKYMALANEAKDPYSGRLQFGPGQPYSVEYIANLLRKPVPLILEAEQHFLNDLNEDHQTPRLVIDEDGTRILTNWVPYQSRKARKSIEVEKANIQPKLPIERQLSAAQVAIGLIKRAEEISPGAAEQALVEQATEKSHRRGGSSHHIKKVDVGTGEVV